MDFDTGKLVGVARHSRPHRRREYYLLGLVLSLALVPYAIAFLLWPLATLCVVLFAAYFQVLISFATSSGTDTAHHIRLLLCGSNPIGMTGASSLLFGAVDSVCDWKEDAGERKRNSLKFYLLSLYKFFITPIGLILMAAEYAWDAALMGRPGLVRHKWNELFALAHYHDLVCPEKSNDLFYADLSFARYQNDPFQYQWNRMRAMVFELKHQFIDAQHGVGVPETNIFLQDDIAAYQTLKRLKIELIEETLDRHYSTHIEQFPVPPSLASQLIRNAQPIAHYLRMRSDLTAERGPPSEASRQLSKLIRDNQQKQFRMWKFLRIIDEQPGVYSAAISRHISQADLSSMADDGILHALGGALFELSPTFSAQFESFLNEYYVRASEEAVADQMQAKVPALLNYRNQAYVLAPDK